MLLWTRGLVRIAGVEGWPRPLTVLLFPLRRRQPGPNLLTQPAHGAGKVLPRLTRIKQLVGDAQGCENGCLLRFDDIPRPHRLLDHVVHVLGYRSGPLGAHVATDRVLIAEDRDANDILLRAHLDGAPLCCSLRNRARSIIWLVRSRASSSRLVRPAFSRSRNCTRSGDTTPFT